MSSTSTFPPTAAWSSSPRSLFLSIPESTVFGDGCITLVSGTREQIAEHRYDELEFDVEC